MRYLVLLYILSINICFAQTDNQSLPEYWENFDYRVNRYQDKIFGEVCSSITIESMKINIPLKYYKDYFNFKRDSTTTIEITEEENERVKYKHEGYTMYFRTRYVWNELTIGRTKEIQSIAITDISIKIRHKYEVLAKTVDSLLDNNDSLRYRLHSILRSSHEKYLLNKFHIDFNIKSALDKVDRVYLYKQGNYESSHNKFIFNDFTLDGPYQFVKNIEGEDKMNLINMFSKNSEYMTRYSTLCFHTEDVLILTDKNNTYLGRINITNDPCPGFDFIYKMTDDVFYRGSAVFYKGYDTIHSIIKKQN